MLSLFYLTLLARTLSCSCSHEEECYVAASQIYCHLFSKVCETHFQAITVQGCGLRRGLVGCAGPFYIHQMVLGCLGSPNGIILIYWKGGIADGMLGNLLCYDEVKTGLMETNLVSLLTNEFKELEWSEITLEKYYKTPPWVRFTTRGETKVSKKVEEIKL